MIRGIIINGVLGGTWGWLLGSLGVKADSRQFWGGMILLAAIIVNCKVE